MGGARGEAGEGTVHVDPRSGRWPCQCPPLASRISQSIDVDLSIEICPGPSGVQG